jgi:hypothetical protein
MSNVNEKPPYIAVVKFKGKSGGFASSETTRYRAELVGLDDTVLRLECDSWGYSERSYVQEIANNYAKATGFNIIAINETKKTNVTFVRNIE